ncbi:MAG: 3-hydroxyacyl-CoA dehydrogenase NAD-binding domain-containing protein [Gemmatimonadota bacterium]|nr:3-hydroxyacyl-CoA dehydrogenase NAD-binding domain-containing protein [Gemmatimonadota bacterium]
MSTRKIGVVGAGTMGSGIAQKIATEGFQVVLVDRSIDLARAGVEQIRQLLAQAVERRIFREEQAAEIVSRVTPAGRMEDLADTELVIEAVFEDLNVKRELFATLDTLLPADTMFATNTSSFLVEDVASATNRADRVVGLHYFFHPAKNRLVEVVPGKDTSPATRDYAWTFCEATGKTPIHSGDSPGFVVNRYFVPWINEAVRLLDEGVADIPTIEAAAMKAFAIGMGPFQLMNVTGIPIGMHAATTLGDRLGPFYAPADALVRQAATGELWDFQGDADETRFDTIRDRLLGVTFLIAAALVDEGVCSVEDADIGARVGLRWAKGPFELANRFGTDEAARMADELADRWDTLESPLLLSERRASAEPFRFRLVQLDVGDGIAEITLNRPDALNALNEEVVAQLDTAFTEADTRTDVSTIVIRGAGKAFVAGADIKFFVDRIDAKDHDSIHAFTKSGQALFRRIDESEKLVICRLDGLSLGGGSELALCADVILASDRGSLGFPETGIGIYPGLGGTQRTTRRIGVPLARWMVLTGTPVDARTALAMGLVDELVPIEKMSARIQELHTSGSPHSGASHTPEGLLKEIAGLFAEADVEALLAGELPEGAEAAAREAGRVKHKAPVATRIADRLVREGAALPLADGLEMELSHLDEIFRTQDAYIGLSSVLARKRPEFTGS